MAVGKVKWFNDAKGYGFITRDEDGSDVFVHYSSIEGDGFRSLAQGEPVKYELEQGPKGLFAVHVNRVEGEPQLHSGSEEVHVPHAAHADHTDHADHAAHA